jgi:hypothetical protein
VKKKKTWNYPPKEPSDYDPKWARQAFDLLLPLLDRKEAVSEQILMPHLRKFFLLSCGWCEADRTQPVFTYSDKQFHLLEKILRRVETQCPRETEERLRREQVKQTIGWVRIPGLDSD